MRSCWLLGGALALLLAGWAGPGRADEKPAHLPPELSWVPPNSAAFIHVRVGELWNIPAVKLPTPQATSRTPSPFFDLIKVTTKVVVAASPWVR